MEAELLLLPGVTVTRMRQSPRVVTRFHPAREEDDFVLVWATAPGAGRLTHGGREIDDDQEDALLISYADWFRAEAHREFPAANVRVKRALLMPLLRDAEDRLMRPIPPGNRAMRLLTTYLDTLCCDDVAEDPEVGHAAAIHICDLIALALGARGDADLLAAGAGRRTARLAALKHWALARLRQPELTVSRAAAAQQVSPRYVQVLFQEIGTTFSAFVLGARLALARRQLGNPLLAHQLIGTIAYEVGFGDLSYFNRAYRAAFGEAPSDTRHRAHGAAG